MKKIWLFISKYSYEILLVLVGTITGALFATKKREEDILSKVGNEIDAIEIESKGKAEEIKRKLNMIKEINDKKERMRKLLELKAEIDAL